MFPELTVGLLHGRLNSAEKQSVLRDFADGRSQVLVSTTVVEVGVDVPEASVMVIDHAERFGLAQLHQLRGRVGRGAAASHCLLINGSSNPQARQRLDVLVRSSDGFEIAEMDLRLRGPGQVLGTRQSGLPIWHWPAWRMMVPCSRMHGRRRNSSWSRTRIFRITRHSSPCWSSSSVGSVGRHR